MIRDSVHRAGAAALVDGSRTFIGVPRIRPRGRGGSDERPVDAVSYASAKPWRHDTVVLVDIKTLTNVSVSLLCAQSPDRARVRAGGGADVSPEEPSGEEEDDGRSQRSE